MSHAAHTVLNRKQYFWQYFNWVILNEKSSITVALEVKNQNLLAGKEHAGFKVIGDFNLPMQWIWWENSFPE